MAPEPGPARSSCARCTPGSAAAPRRWCSGAGSRRASGRRCGRRSRTVVPGPVKYGYLSVGVVERGPDDLDDPGRPGGTDRVLPAPHQTAYVVPASAVVPVPDDVPARRAVLAGTVETALNALWDLGPLVGDRVTVVGAGMVGCCVARLLARIPEVEVALVDVDPGRAEVAEQLGVAFQSPGRDRPAGRRRAHQRDGVRPPACPWTSSRQRAPSST